MSNALCIWFTGLPCAGKTTLAVKLAEELEARGERVIIFDGDAVRRSLSADLGFSRNDRHANVLRVAAEARDAVENGAIAVCALISPYGRSRSEARRLIGAHRFVEVYVNTSREICEARDSKGMYRLAREGKLTGFTGVDDPYEPPESPQFAIASVGELGAVIASILEELDRWRFERAVGCST